MRLASIALLIATPFIALAHGPDESTQLFRAMEKRLTGAKQLLLRFDLAVEANGKTLLTLKGTMIIAEGDRIRVRSDRTGFTADHDRSEMISDGKRLQLSLTNTKEGKVSTVPCPKGLSATFAKVLCYT